MMLKRPYEHHGLYWTALIFNFATIAIANLFMGAA